MKVMHRKKGEGDISARKIIFYIIFGFLLTLSILVIVFVVPKKNAEIAEIPTGLEDHILKQKFLNSPRCFAFQDEETKHTKHKVIDIEKFTENRLRECYDTENSNIMAYRFTLEYQDKRIEIATDNFRGFPGKTTANTVFVRENNNIIESKLTIESHE